MPPKPDNPVQALPRRSARIRTRCTIKAASASTVEARQEGMNRRRGFLRLWKNQALVCALAAFFALSASAGELHSKTWIATGLCNGIDETPILQTPWEDTAISIIGVGIGLTINTDAPDPGTYVFGGNSFVPDPMALHMGTGSETIMYPNGESFPFPAAGDGTEPHVDAHVSCSTPLLPPEPAPTPPWTVGRSLRVHFPWVFGQEPVPSPIPARPAPPLHYQVWLTIFYERGLKTVSQN
jgi:hypothetical protein